MQTLHDIQARPQCTAIKSTNVQIARLSLPLFLIAGLGEAAEERQTNDEEAPSGKAEALAGNLAAINGLAGSVATASEEAITAVARMADLPGRQLLLLALNAACWKGAFPAFQLASCPFWEFLDGRKGRRGAYTAEVANLTDEHAVGRGTVLEHMYLALPPPSPSEFLLHRSVFNLAQKRLTTNSKICRRWASCTASSKLRLLWNSSIRDAAK